MVLEIVVAAPADAAELATVAAATFPLACPPSVTHEDVATFIDAQLSAIRFTEYLADPDKRVLALSDWSSPSSICCPATTAPARPGC